MKRHHPDAGAATLSDDKAGRIARAYWELRHPDRRAAYDARLWAECRREARRYVVTLQTTVPPARRPPRGTRLIFVLSLAGAITLVSWIMHQRPQPPADAPARVQAELGKTRHTKASDDRSRSPTPVYFRETQQP